jgi:hypothetical protein
MKKLVLGAMLSVALLALVAMPASAAARKAALYNSPEYTCPGGAANTSGPALGFVVMNINGKRGLIVEVSLKRAKPNATYDIWVNQDPGACPLSAPTAAGALKTNRMGNGNAKVKLPAMAGATHFWVSAVSGDQVLRSTAVSLR